MTTNPWDVREAEKAEKDPDALYLIIGKALSAWEGMEQRLSYLFAYFCVGTGGGEEAFPSKRAFGSVVTFRGRADMLRAAADAYFFPLPDHAMKQRFFDLLNLVCNFSPRRNEIAHGYVTNVFFELEEGEDLPKMGDIERSMKAMRWLHCPPEYATNKHVPIEIKEGKFLRRKYAYSVREIEYYRQQFHDLENSIWKLLIDWSEKYPEEDILPPF